MIDARLENKFKAYYVTAIFSLVFAIVGFSYNAWRMEISEDNNNIRTAAFEVLTELAELQQLIYAAHYDQDPIAGNPRTGWVKIELIVDLSSLVGKPVLDRATNLHQNWKNNWDTISSNQQATDRLGKDIDQGRAAIKMVLKNLE